MYNIQMLPRAATQPGGPQAADAYVSTSITAAALLTNQQLRFKSSNELPKPQQTETSTIGRITNVTIKALNEILGTLET
jgi:hypothetical protein